MNELLLQRNLPEVSTGAFTVSGFAGHFRYKQEWGYIGEQRCTMAAY